MPPSGDAVPADPGCRLPVTALSTVEQVRDMASEAAWSRYCNRLLIVNNSLFIQWAHQVRRLPLSALDGRFRF